MYTVTVKPGREPCAACRQPQFSGVPHPSPLLTHFRIELAALALAGAGFWLVPEDPALPALLLTAVALPLMLLSWLDLWIAERPARRPRRGLAPASYTAPGSAERPGRLP